MNLAFSAAASLLCTVCACTACTLLYFERCSALERKTWGTGEAHWSREALITHARKEDKDGWERQLTRHTNTLRKENRRYKTLKNNTRRILRNRHDTGMEECVIDRYTQIEHMLYAHLLTKKRDTEPLIFSSSVFSFSSCKLTFFFFLCHVFMFYIVCSGKEICSSSICKPSKIRSDLGGLSHKPEPPGMGQHCPIEEPLN